MADEQEITLANVANVDWAAFFSKPGRLESVLRYIEANPTSEIAQWFAATFSEQAKEQPSKNVSKQRKKKLRSTHHDWLAQNTHVERIRAADCKSWIKKTNFDYNGAVRKRKPELRVPRKMANQRLSFEQHQRHAINLMGRVLNIRSNASPFTLILDDLSQRARPLADELVRRALSRNLNVVIVTFEAQTFHPAIRGVFAFNGQTGDQILQEIATAMQPAQESLVIIDSMYDLLEDKKVDMTALFNLVVMQFASTLIGVYHQDMLPAQEAQHAYVPQTPDLIKYMATTIITCKSFAHVLAAKAARERSLPEPTYGLLQGAEGVVQSLNANDIRGIVFETEFRRQSGRVASETFFLRPGLVSDYHPALLGLATGTLKLEFVILLDMVPTYASKEVIARVDAAGAKIDATFNLALTEKQKKAREDVVLPYFDAQKGEGGEGGRILYDMGSEDDFDEEEDEF